MTLVPSADVGIFVALTGNDPWYIFRTNLHLYIADLLLGYEPWLNTTTICTFPEPWMRRVTSQSETEVRRDLNAHRKLEEYTGVYFNHAYGALNFTLNTTSNRLVMHYGFGVFDLYPKTEKDEFRADGTGALENIRRFSTLRFQSDKPEGIIKFLLVPSFESKMPPRFEKTEVSQSASLGSNKKNTAFFLVSNFYATILTCLFVILIYL